VQDQIQDLLEKLRELNDVQIVIEVRFITLQDDFFERIGIDFDFELNDNTGLTAIPDETNGSVVVGSNGRGRAAFTPSSDLDLQYLQDSFGASAPVFGGFDPGSVASFGFAILSDIEVFFLINAVKGDTRSNIMQAPTVTMFNGQSANVQDASAVPFVTSVIPVVGDFAVAQQPIITILPEGTSLNVQAVVSDDRRFVRLNLVPFFSQITAVDTFTFDGSVTTRRSQDSLLNDLLDRVNNGGNNNNNNNNADEDFETVNQGVTVQLPTLAFTTVNTVVSVPDGGTILMGGIKRMSEGRTERGVPFLSNIPYINRLFKNVGIGRETTSLMMMVSPKIIIQEEEEENQVGTTGGN
jgi:general secretion pathway protein D